MMQPDAIDVGINRGIAYPSRAAAWYATVTLAFLYWLSLLDRFIISLLVEPIQRDLGLSDVQFGLLHGFAFAFTFAVFGLVAGMLADRWNRRLVICIGVSVWSLATAGCGLAQNFWHLFLARVGVGAGEAALNPCATSIIADMFPRDRMTSAMTVYAMGATAGAGFALIFGGSIVELVTVTEYVTVPFLGQVRSWQAVFLIIGLPGVLLSLVVFGFPEPARRDRAAMTSQVHWSRAYVSLLKFMKSRQRFFMSHYVGFALASMVFTGCMAWYPVHLSRSFGWSPAEIGMSLGIVIAISGVFGKFVSGRAMDALFRRGMRDAQMRWYACCLVIATPLGVTATLSDSPWVFLGCMSVYLMLLSSLPACYATALHLVTPNELRGANVAFFGATAGLVASGLGAVVVALFADYLYEGKTAIGNSMATVIAVFCPIAAAILWVGCKPMREAVASASWATS